MGLNGFSAEKLENLNSRPHFVFKTVNSIGWHHSPNQRDLLHFSIVLYSPLQNHDFSQNVDPEKFACAMGCFVSYQKLAKQMKNRYVIFACFCKVLFRFVKCVNSAKPGFT